MRETERLHSYTRRRFFAELLVAAVALSAIGVYAVYRRHQHAQPASPAVIVLEKAAATVAPDELRRETASTLEKSRREADNRFKESFPDWPRLEVRSGMQTHRKPGDKAYR